MKAFVSKVETLQDQSVKLSLHLPKELFLQAASLAYKEVSVIDYAEAIESQRSDKDTAIHLACQGIDKIKKMLIGELVQSVKPEGGL